jgi:two-component system, OmpR family, sensor histidine kinase VicK
VKFRYVTEITKDNISYCKEMLKFAEIRHLDGVKGNFEVSDEREYVGTANLKQPEEQEQSIPQLIHSDVKEVVEQQQYVFDSFWNRAIPSEQKIREIDYGIMPEVTEVIQSPEEAERREWDILRRAKEEVQIIYSTANAFYIQERTGTIDFLNQLAEEGISIKLLTPTDNYIRKSIENLKQQHHHYHHHQKQQQNNDNNNIVEFRNIASTLGIKIKSLVVDRKYSLIMEVKDDSKEAISTAAAAATGWSIYSNSQAIVLSYVSIFETLWRQTELYEQLQQTDRIKTEFINIAAHELRTPIMPIIGYAELLEEEEEGLEHNEKRKESVTAIIRNAKRLQRLANDILDVTKIESKSLNIKKEQLNLNDLILNVLDDILINTKEEEFKGADNNINRNSNSSNNRRKFLYKASEEEIIIQADRTRLIQVISNLIDNAIKFTKQEEGERGGGGGGTISIVVEKKRKENINNDNNTNEDEKVIVSIKDTGTGIDSEILPRLFTKFASKSSKGTGLGLFISKGIIEAHGGIIWAENNSDGKGATFSFTLPIK